MKKSPYIFLAIWLWMASPAMAVSDLTQAQFLEGTGMACVVGGVMVKVAALAAGPATIGALTSASLALPVPVTSTVAAMLGCGVGAAAAVIYYSTYWGYETFFLEPQYPLLYPALAPKVIDTLEEIEEIISNDVQ